MLYPSLEPISVQRLWTEEFIGLDRRPRTNDGAFSAMGNMTGKKWPLLSARKKRGLVAELDAPRGMTALGKIAWIDGGTLYFDGQATPVNSLSQDAGMLPKRIVTMGAYILIFPDGYYYNTVDAEDWGNINRLYASAAGQETTFQICDMDGTIYPSNQTTVSDTPPSDPQDGDYWLNTSGETHALYKWYEQENEWVGIPTVYIKISGAGIGAGLNIQDNVTLSGIEYSGTSDTLREQLEFLNATHVIQAAGENYIVVIGIIDQSYTQTTGTIRADRKAPEMDLIIECNNRLWGCRYGEQDGETVNRIYACALGDFKNWQKFMGTSQDSYFVNVGTDGPFTGAAVHRGSPYFFKEKYAHKIYGEKPSNFQTMVTECEGVRPGSENTVVSYNGVLYYLGDHGPQAFESLSQDTGRALGESGLSLGAAGALDGKYYLSAMEENGEWSLYVMDLDRGIWHRQDGSHALSFAVLGGEIYMLEENGCLWALNGTEGTEEEGDVTWFAETAVMGYEYPDRKYLSRFLIRMKMGINAECAIKIQYDSDGIWRPKGTLEGSGRVKSYLVPVVPRRCDHLKIRIEGHGDMEIYGFARELSMGSDAK